MLEFRDNIILLSCGHTTLIHGLSRYHNSRTLGIILILAFKNIEYIIRNHKDLSYCYVNYYYLIPDFYDSPIISQPESRVDSFDDACLVYILLWTTYGYT